MEKIQIKSLSGSVIFEHEAKNNTVKLTVEAAVSCGVSLAWANLESADLAGATLVGANLNGADLADAKISSSVLSWADFVGANLKGADIKGADLSWADLADANLKDANLKDANLKRAFLEGADLKGADITGANLNGANLNGAKNIPYIPLSCPSEGAFIGWKKVNNEYLVKLQIPEDARRLSATTNKCRCDKAMVLDITSLDGKEHFEQVFNYNYKKTIYKVGEMVYPDSFDENRWKECSHGIHFFINKQDAINY